MEAQLECAVYDLLLNQFLALKGMGDVDAERIVLLIRQLYSFPNQQARFRQIDDFLQHCFVLRSGVHKDSIFNVDKPISFADVASQSLYEVMQVWLKQQQPALFVVSPSSNGLPNKHSV